MKTRRTKNDYQIRRRVLIKTPEEIELLRSAVAYIEQLKEENMKLKQRLNALYGKDAISSLEKLVSKTGPITIPNPNANKKLPNGFVKFTQLDGNFIFVNVGEIRAVYEHNGNTMVNTSMSFPVSVEETADEVMDKIKES